MWTSQQIKNRRITKFFRLTLSQESLFNYFNMNFSLMQHHKYSLTELENMIPWEREVYITMLLQHIKNENERLKMLKQNSKHI